MARALSSRLQTCNDVTCSRVLASIPGFFALIYVPGKIIVHANAAATAHNTEASETLFRLGIATGLLGQALFIYVALALYDLLKPVRAQRDALAMLFLNGPARCSLERSHSCCGSRSKAPGRRKIPPISKACRPPT